MKKALIAVGVAATGALLLVAANYHIVTGSTVSGVSFQKKMSMSLSETFVNLDSVGNMPMIVARAQYPMFVASMERGVSALQDELKKRCGSDLAAGMALEEVIKRCGSPATVETHEDRARTMRWNTGLIVKVEDGLVTYYSAP